MNIPTEMKFDRTWTLFLDRDGVINQRLMNDYIKTIEGFVFLDGVLEAMPIFNQIFGQIVVVTNQQGIEKGLMTQKDLYNIHARMLNSIRDKGGRIDAIYHCPELANTNAECRKPNTGMALEAKTDFPEIDFEKSVMIGDSISDMEFGRKLGMTCVFVGEHEDYDSVPSLIHFARRITSK